MFVVYSLSLKLLSEIELDPVNGVVAPVAELNALGVEIKGLDVGLVDFPGEMEGRPVYLCWRYGEPSVSHWHELETGFSGRQPIDDPDAFMPTYPS